jgi:hypothetical protein
VFPVLKGEGAGERQGKRSQPRALRVYLRRAGLHHPLDGFVEALATLRTGQATFAELRAGRPRAR